MHLPLLAAFAAAMAAVGCFAEAHPTNVTLDKRANINPIMGGQNFPDPGVIRVHDGWHAFATNAKVNGKLIHVQVAYSPDWKKWTYRKGKDALPKLPPWADKKNPRVWAPEVTQLNDGSFIMYYSVAWKAHPAIHCVSWATSKKVEGPYNDPTTSPWICPLAKGGAIDAAGYRNKDGTRWVVYKVDGNAVGHGGVCGNTVKPIVPTPILLQQVRQDGHTKIGNPIQLITNGPADGPVVEAPVLTNIGDKYVLFFSSNCFATPKYDIAYATSKNIKGPYRKFGPLYVTGNLGMRAPGGLSIAVNGDHAMWHANFGKGRASFTGILSQRGNLVTARNLS
ncbi:glycoside hydrolase family 43 protein [Hortaea werneckii]|nr:glycoside hydrolase family 43 protein [Hortaea werneckii]KAI7107339.1 glycoside hydrolase family 43 protein [Hortaea werneckii]KAI7236810.1 glycoside hydrolase family 43 protein [Hortaea werneckii]KAI7338038.1 glycoside hydrolase family 43 protein [Hortaea werneckii]KAI7385375.1 glycoside hydrolase family 43 protein [Hortaea werneckii]